MHKTYFSKYIQFLWQKRIDTKLANDGYELSTYVYLSPIPIPKNISRQEEVSLLSLFYKNNLTNHSLHRIDASRYSDPFCPHGCQEEETSFHTGPD